MTVLIVCPGFMTDKFPWFAAMRGLVDKRPNCIPTGLGNSRSEIDLGVLQDALSQTGDTEEQLGIVGSLVRWFHDK
jgi:hypothetical protein